MTISEPCSIRLLQRHLSRQPSVWSMMILQGLQYSIKDYNECTELQSPTLLLSETSYNLSVLIQNLSIHKYTKTLPDQIRPSFPA